MKEQKTEMNGPLANLLKEAKKEAEERNMTEIEKIISRKKTFDSKTTYYKTILKQYFEDNGVEVGNIDILDKTFISIVTIKTTDDYFKKIKEDPKEFKKIPKTTQAFKASLKNKVIINEEKGEVILELKKQDDGFTMTTKDVIKKHKIDIFSPMGTKVDITKLEKMLGVKVRMYDNFVEDPNQTRIVSIVRIFTNSAGTLMVEFDKPIAVGHKIDGEFPSQIIEAEKLLIYNMYDIDFKPFFGFYKDTDF